MQSLDGAQPYTKAERLLNLLMALRGTRTGLDRAQIRAQVRGYVSDAAPEAFERMFERDKDELRSLGVPVRTLTDASGVVTGYRIDGDWTLPPLDLDRAELAVLGLAARVWQSAELAPAALNALRKVEARLGMQSSADLPAPVAGLSADSPVLPALIDACSTRTPVAFDYRKDPASPARRRHLQPWGVVWWRGHWYVVGHDGDREDVRVFRASRIEGSVSADPGGRGYDVPAGFDVRSAVGRFADSDRFTVTAAVAAGAGASLRRRATVVGTDPQGWDLLAVSAASLVEAVSAVLALGSVATVTAPEHAVREAARQLDALLAALASPPARTGRPAAGAGTRPAAGAAQFSRLLALVPWLAANSGVTVAQAAQHFGISEEQLRQDLGSVITSGADDWTLFDIQYWDDGGVIRVIDALDLTEPLSLTPDEGFALLVALHALAAVPGAHDRAVLESTTTKLTAVLGASAPAHGAVAVRVDVPDEVAEQVGAALAAGRTLHLTYVGAVRDEVTERVVDPVGIVVIDGYAYLRAHCRSAGGMRLFHAERILDLCVGPEPAAPVDAADAAVEPMAVTLAATGLRVVVDLPEGSPIPDRHPVLRRWSLPGGGTRAELPVGDFGWARRLVLGSAGLVVPREPAWLVDQLTATARAMRAALGVGDGPGVGAP